MSKMLGGRPGDEAQTDGQHEAFTQAARWRCILRWPLIVAARVVAVALFAALCLLSPNAFGADPPPVTFGVFKFPTTPQVQFPAPPASADDAIKTLADRRMAVAQYMACGDEITFWRKTVNIPNEPGSGTDNLIGKMLWLLLPNHPRPVAQPTVTPPPAPPAPGGGDIHVNERDDVPRMVLAANGATDVPPLVLAATGGAPETDDIPCVYTQEIDPLTLRLWLGFGSDKDFPDIMGLGSALDGDAFTKTLQHALDPPAGQAPADPKAFVDRLRTTLNRQMETPGPPSDPHAGYGRRCLDIIKDIQVKPGTPNASGGNPMSLATVFLTFSVSQDCMRRQINFALQKIQVKDQLGSSGVACLSLTKDDLPTVTMTEGEWDVNVRDFIRMIYLDRLHKRAQILDVDTSKHVLEDLITVDGPPGLTSYGLLQCGDQEKHTGSAEERDADHSWLDDTLSSIGDLFDWFAHRLVLLLAVAVALGLLAALLGLLGGAGALIAGLAAVLGLSVLFMRFPETENHLLNLETSRYLNNQVIISELEAEGDDASRWHGYQSQLKDWFLDKFQTILREDFQEYNGRAYSRYSVNAILNLAQFAQDPDLRSSARMALDYVTAKAAAGSLESRRRVPQRRKMEAILMNIDRSFFENDQLGDHLIPYMLLYTGQTQQMGDELWGMLRTGTDRPPHPNLVLNTLIAQMTSHASSTIPPEDAPGSNALLDLPTPSAIVLDIAINKTTPYEQRIKMKDAGIEIYSSGASWLVSAGGIETPAANTAFLQMGTKIKLQQLSKKDDNGSAWPTILMMPGGWEKTRLVNLLRIEGLRVSHPAFGLDDKDMMTFDGNACVALGFACGFNLIMPDQYEPTTSADDPVCKGNLERQGPWTFIDTNQCVAYDKNAQTFVAVFRKPCPTKACLNFGLFEAVSASDPSLPSVASSDEKFAEFKRRVLENTDAIQVEPGGALSLADVKASGTYVSAKEKSPGVRHRIGFDATASDNTLAVNFGSPTLSRITSVDGLTMTNHIEWRIAAGDLIRGESDGRIEIGRTGGPLLILDMTDKNNPRRELR